MSPVLETQDARETYLADFSKVETNLPGSHLSSLRRIRRQAIERFAELGFPTTNQEEWRFTSVEPIATTSFALADRPAHFPLHRLKESTLYHDQGIHFTFINNHYFPEFSHLPELPEGVSLKSLNELLRTDPERIEPFMAQNNGEKDSAFAALNVAFFQDGVFMHVSRGITLEQPIHLLFLSTGPAVFAAHPRILVRLEEGARVSIIEEYAGCGEEVYFTNTVTEMMLGENAVVEHYKLQRENLKAFHLAEIQIHQDRNSSYAGHSISLGAALARNDIRVRQEAEGASCTLNGLSIIQGRQHVDHHTWIDHLKPHGTSRELYKGILDGQSRAVFNGMIAVHPLAQKTNATVYNKNLILSEKGLVHTKPEFRINANDVQCKHGATVGQLSADALFYLRSRGISYASARNLLIYAFASEMVEQIAIPALKEAVDALLRQNLKD